MWVLFWRLCHECSVGKQSSLSVLLHENVDAYAGDHSNP